MILIDPAMTCAVQCILTFLSYERERSFLCEILILREKNWMKYGISVKIPVTSGQAQLQMISQGFLKDIPDSKKNVILHFVFGWLQRQLLDLHDHFLWTVIILCCEYFPWVYVTMIPVVWPLELKKLKQKVKVETESEKNEIIHDDCQ